MAAQYLRSLVQSDKLFTPSDPYVRNARSYVDGTLVRRAQELHVQAEKSLLGRARRPALVLQKTFAGGQGGQGRRSLETLITYFPGFRNWYELAAAPMVKEQVIIAPRRAGSGYKFDPVEVTRPGQQRERYRYLDSGEEVVKLAREITDDLSDARVLGKAINDGLQTFIDRTKTDLEAVAAAKSVARKLLRGSGYVWPAVALKDFKNDKPVAHLRKTIFRRRVILKTTTTQGDGKRVKTRSSLRKAEAETALARMMLAGKLEHEWLVPELITVDPEAVEQLKTISAFRAANALNGLDPLRLE